jgi:hypothetical protein
MLVKPASNDRCRSSPSVCDRSLCNGGTYASEARENMPAGSTGQAFAIPPPGIR